MATILNKNGFREVYIKYKDYFGMSLLGDVFILKDVIRELNHQLRLCEPNETAILLLDYLTYYYYVLNTNS